MDKKTFKPSTQMTFATVQADSQRLQTFFKESRAEEVLQLNLSEVSLCDSAGLALLIEAKRIAKEQNKCCKILEMPEKIQALAEFSGVFSLLGLEPTQITDA